MRHFTLITFFLVLVFYSASAQTLSGPTTVCIETNHTNSHAYTLSNPNGYIVSTTWSAWGGEIISQTTNSANVRWKSNLNGTTYTGILSAYHTVQVCETIYPDPYWYCQNETYWVCDWDWELQDWVNCRWETTQVCDWAYPPPYSVCNNQEYVADLNVYSDAQRPASSFSVAYNCGVNYTITRSAAPPANETWYWQDTFDGFSTANSASTYTVTTSGTKYLRAKKGNCWSNPVSVVVLSDAPSVGGSVTPNREAFGTASYNLAGSITLTGNTGSVVRWEQSTNSGSTWQSLSNTTTSYPYANVTANTLFRAIVKNGVCAEVPSAAASVTIYPIPTVSITGVTTLPYAGQTVLTCSTTYYNYKWYKDGTYVSTLIGKTPTIKEPGNYKVEVFGSATSPGYFSNEVTINSLGSQTSNYISTVRIRKAGVTTSTNLYTLTPQEVAQSLEYQDGLGRPIQAIQVGQSPMSGDIVQPIAYDAFGMSPTTYLPYTTPSISGTQRDQALLAGANYTLSEQYKFYQGTYNAANAVKITNDVAPYAKTTFDNSPLFRVVESGAPGTDWQPGSTHTVRPVFRVNTAADNVKIWTVAGPATVAPLTYTAGLLGVSETTDENGNKVLTFSDKLGRTLLKRVQIDDTLEGTLTTFLETYYVYDDLGNLAIQVPPKATAKINSGTAWSVAFRDQWCFVYTYDVRNRLVEKKVPDAAAVYYAYDRFDRLVLTQDGYLRGLNKWMFVKYDVKGRPIMSGLYLNATNTTRTAIQTSVLDPLYATGVWYEERGATLHGYTNLSFPMTNLGGTALEIFSINYYDNYDFDNNGTADYSYVSQGITGEGTQATTFGVPTGSKRLVLGSSPASWLFDYVFYDKFSRVIQVRSNNHLSAALDNLTTRVYDFEGKVLQTKTYHNGGGTNQVTVVNKFNYDDAGRLLKVFQSNNGAADQLLAQYEYNELGKVVDKKLHNTTGTTFLQSVDYRYNIRGWLTSINNAQLNTDSRNDDTNDFFGLELLHNTAETGLNSGVNDKKYNGNISAIKWKGPGPAGVADQRSYKYDYDKSDRLKTATFQAYNQLSSNWTKEASTLNEAMTYDHNGNIKSLIRNQNQRSNSGITVTSAAQPIDNLTYTYTTGNQISKVEDSGLSTGFTNVNNPTEYIYNANGSLTKDDNKGIQTISYNELGKPLVITYSGTPTKTVQYTYDASGSKLKMVTTVGSTVTTTNYVGGFVYDGAAPALSFFGSPEGRVIKNGSAFEYQYALADHQGNTRVVFTSATPAPVATSTTMEAATDANFQNYTNRVGFNLMDHTDAGTTYTYAQKLTGGYNAQVGVAKSYKVYAGDKVKIEAWGKYTNPTSTSSNIAGFASALFAAFGVPAPAGGETGTISSALNIWGGLVAGGTGGTNPSGPKAFVNIIVFDKNYKYMDAAWDGISSAANQVGATPVVPHEYMMQEYTIKEEGYVFMYVSNENATLVDMYFDDIVMTHTKSNVIQYNEYYPFGMQTANSWTRENTKGNNYLSNGGTELNTTTGVYDLHYRNYDPVLGRMNQVDPLADRYGSHSTYNFAFNDPVYWNDPLGDSPHDEINASRGIDMQRNYANSYRTIGDDDMYGSIFGKAGTLGFDYSSPTPSSMWAQHLSGIFPGDVVSLDYLGYDVSTEQSSERRYFTKYINGKSHFWSRSVSVFTKVITLKVGKVQQQLTQDVPGKVWYTWDHLSNMDIVRQHTLVRTAKEEVTTTRVVVINYTDGLFGTDHEIIPYGIRTKTYSLDDLEWSPKVLDMPRYSDPIYGDFKPDEAFYNYIYGTVNEHLDCDCYMQLIPTSGGRLNTGAPHR